MEVRKPPNHTRLLPKVPQIAAMYRKPPFEVDETSHPIGLQKLEFQPPTQ